MKVIEWGPWVIVRIDPEPDIFIICPCGQELRLVDDRPAECPDCHCQFVATISVIGRKPASAPGDGPDGRR